MVNYKKHKSDFRDQSIETLFQVLDYEQEMLIKKMISTYPH